MPDKSSSCSNIDRARHYIPFNFGSVYGNVDVLGDLEIASTGRIEGEEVRANNLISQGIIKAQIQATAKVTLTATAKVEGDGRRSCSGVA